MFKKILAAILAITLVFSLAACGGKGGGTENTTQPNPLDVGKSQNSAIGVNSVEVKLPSKKVAILVAPEAQYPEDYKTAMSLATAYPETVVVKEYADSRILIPGDPEIVNLSKEIAADSAYGAIIYARATRYTSYAISQAKTVAESNGNDIKFICVEPEDNVYDVSKKADLVLCADWKEASFDYVEQISSQGAKHILMFSFKRHITDNPLIGANKVYLEQAAKKKSINFVYYSALDSNGSANDNNLKEAEDNIYYNILEFLKTEGVDPATVALYSTDSAIQKLLIKVANEKGCIYAAPSFPTAYNGLGEAYSAAMPADIRNTSAYIDALKNAVSADTAGKAKFACYEYPLISTLITAAVYSSFDILNGDINADNMFEKVSLRIKDAANDGTLTFNYYDKSNPGNVYICYRPGFVTVK